MNKIAKIIFILIILILTHLLIENWNAPSYLAGVVIGLYLSDLFEGEE